MLAQDFHRDGALSGDHIGIVDTGWTKVSLFFFSSSQACW